MKQTRSQSLEPEKIRSTAVFTWTRTIGWRSSIQNSGWTTWGPVALAARTHSTEFRSPGSTKPC